MVVAALAAVALLAGTAIMIDTGSLRLPGSDPLGAASVCEKSLLQELRSPSSYKRVSVDTKFLQPLSYSEFLAQQLTSSCDSNTRADVCRIAAKLGIDYVATDVASRKQIGIAELKAKSRKEKHDQALTAFYEENKRLPLAQQRTAQVTLVYDAANSYNALLRDTKVCRFGPIKGRSSYTADDMFDPTANVAADTDWSPVEDAATLRKLGASSTKL